MGSFSILHWIIVLVVLLMVFGTKKLRNIGADLGGAVKGFKDGMKSGSEGEGGTGAPGSGEAPPQVTTQARKADGHTVDVEAKTKSR